jgi:hypothetical protein
MTVVKVRFGRFRRSGTDKDRPDTLRLNPSANPGKIVQSLAAKGASKGRRKSAGEGIHPGAQAKQFGQYWALLDLPRHLSLFDRKCLSELCDKAGMNLVVFKTHCSKLHGVISRVSVITPTTPGNLCAASFA